MIKIQRNKKKTNYMVELTESLNQNLIGYTKLSRCPEIIMAIDKIADLVSNMTLYLMENSEMGDVRIQDGLSRKLDIDPCEGMTRKQWIHFIVRTLLLEGDGNAVVIPEYTKEGLIKNLRPVPASHFAINLDSDFTKGYKIQVDNKLYKPDTLIHFVINPSPDNPYKGQSYRIQLKDLTKTLKAGQETKQDFLNGRYMPSLVIRIASDDEEIMSDEGKDRILDKYIGSNRAGKPWVVPDDLVTNIQEIKPLSLNDIAINDTLEADKRTVAALIGVPAFMLGVGEFNKTEYNNFIKDKILSIAKVIEQTLTKTLLISNERYFKFNSRSLYAYDMSTIANVGANLFNKGIMTGNEVRDWIGMSPKEGLDENLILENYIPTDKVGDQKKLEQTEEENE